jgi:hypothetical protein
MAGTASLHGKTLVASLVILLFAGALIRQAADRAEGDAADLIVEHTASFGLGVSVSTAGDTRFAEITNGGTETIHVSLPEHWERREVRNVPLFDILSSVTSSGSVRWSLPVRAAVSYRTDIPWSHIVVRNPSKIPFKIDLAIVNLETQETERDVILVKDKPVIIP